MKKKTLLTCTVLVSIFVQSIAGMTKETSKTGKTFVLVHGAWQAPYAWDMVKNDLVKKGNVVIVIELLGHGNDDTAPVKASIDAYSNQVVESIKNIKGKVILVGHSMGGMVISATAEKIPERIESLVYLGAFLPGNGESLMSLTMQDKLSILGPAIRPSADQLTLGLEKESIVPVFCQDANDQIKKLVLENYKVEPAIPFGDKVSLTAANFGKTKKYYIHTLLDNAVGIDLQKQMVTASTNVKKEFALNSGHLPHLTQPREVSKILLEIAVSNK